jgi:hypothetical protein
METGAFGQAKARNSTMPGSKAIYPIAAALLIAACASFPEPKEDIGDAEAAIERAQDARASEFAAFELEQAGRKLERAKDLSTGPSEEKIQAMRLAQEATLDARLAEEKAKLARTQQTYEDIQRAMDSRRVDESAGAKGGKQ